MRIILPVFILMSAVAGCSDREKSHNPLEDSVVNRKNAMVKRLPGKNEKLLTSEIERGQVLIGYSDCYTCHTIDEKAKGPSFRDIARRYPVNEGYITLLAKKIIIGGSGVWGYPVITPHPGLSEEHARLMVKYILSLK